jgi:branched-chain amino acid transport system substrate-binding protein
MQSTYRAAAILVAATGLFASTSTRADIVIGVAGPMSGQYASGGEQMRNGVEAAAAAINASGGVLGQKLKVEVGDDACDPKQAVSVANAMVNKKVSAIVGHYCSSSTIPASEVYSESQIPVITGSTNDKITDRGLNNIFRVTGRDGQQGAVAADYFAKKFSGKKVAVVDDKSAYGKGLADVVARHLAGAGMAPALRDSITAGEKDYSALISKLKADGVDVLFYGGYYTEVGLILRQAAQAGLKLQVMGGDTLTSAELVAAAGPALDGLLFTFLPDPRKSPASFEVVKQFRDKKIEPEGYVLFSYASVQIYAQALERARSLTYADVQKALARGDFNTVLGKVDFDAKGDPKNPGFVVYQWKGGQYDVIK